MTEDAPQRNLEPAAAHHIDVVTPHDGLEPVDTFAGTIPDHARATEHGSLQLETRGLTSQYKQGALFRSETVWKATISAKLREMGDYELANGLDECHSIQSVAQCRGCKRSRTFWNRCDRFYCPVCQPRLAKERAESVEWWTKSIDQPKHVVLTVRNTEHITFNQVKEFKKSITKLRRTRFARNWRGGMWSLEVTNESRGWHLHAHLLVDAHYIDARQLAMLWGKCVGQEFGIVKVKDCRRQDYLREVTKYTVKGSQLAQWSGEDILHFIYAIHGQRTFGVFGALYGKRTQWREWLDTLKESAGACECGCNNWCIYTESEYEFWLASNPTVAALPPPKAEPAPQLAFKL